MKLLLTILLWVGVLAGVAGFFLRVPGAIFFTIFWMLGIGAWHHYRSRRRR